MATDKLNGLTPFLPEVVAAPVCAACLAFAPTCIVPVGDGAKPMCWVCAHHVIDHEIPVQHAGLARCKCSAKEIYPSSVMVQRSLAGAA